MIPARWQQIDKLFHSTLEYAPEKRAAFLAQECGGDAELHREVESLVAALEQDGSFLEAPAYEVAPEFVVESLAGLVTGQQIGPYKIMSPLATGGMGEVYLAYDSRLGRKIALKLLPSDFARDEYRVRRFAQEARAASTLSHPNVCVIHEIGQTKDGRHFIAMEYIDGITLRERILQGALPLTEALFVAEQIAAALAAAHAAGVVHRDVKPENIMLRRDGYVKVLDFGLAKLNESESGPPDTTDTVSQVHTEPGTQMGTVRYMSPEHLRERPVDERADIWSFGVVLYEMVTGVTPFEARSRNEVIAMILKRRPKFSFGDDVPLEYQNIVAKALNKSRRERYQTVDALAANLKSLRRQLQGETAAASLTAEHVVAIRDPVTTTNPLDAARLRRELRPYATTARWSTALTYVSRTANHILTGIGHHPGTTVFAGVAVVLVLLLGLNSNWFSKKPPSPTKMTPLTNAGQSVLAVISPDGKLFAHVEKKDGMEQLLVTNIATAGTSVVVPPGNFKYRGIVFSREGNYLYLTRSDDKTDAASLYQVALPGSAPRKLLDGVNSPISFSPDGGRFSFVRFNREAGEYSLMIANVEGSGEREIARRNNGKRLSVEGSAWSPDDKSIAYGAGSWDTGYRMNLFEVNIATGQEVALSESKQWFAIYHVAWLGDKSGLIISAREQALSPAQLWYVSYPQGEITQMTNDTLDYSGASLSRDGLAIVSVQGRQDSKIWLAPAEDVGARAVSSNAGVSHGLGLGWTSKGKVVFSSLAGNHLNISVVDPDGSNQTQLTVNAGDNYTPCTSPDGRTIVFASNRTGSFNIWRMNADDGSDSRQLTFSDGNFYPAISPDGRWIAFENQSNAAASVWRIPIEGGQPERLTDGYARMPSISPDGQFIACRYYIGARLQGIAVIPAQGGKPVRLLEIPIMEWQRVQWTADGRALTYIDTDNGVGNIWSYDLNTGSRKRITNFRTDEIFFYAWSPDYKQFACERGTRGHDVTMITLQR